MINSQNLSIDYYKKNGFLIIKNFHSKKLINQIKKDIFEISFELYRKYNSSSFPVKYTSETFDKFILQAKKENLAEVTSSIYDACKKVRGFYQIMGNEKILDLSEKLIGSKKIGLLNRGFGVRIDYPQDRYWKARLHQDYTSQLGSPNGIVIYTSLRDVKQKMGPVLLYSKSHKHGVFQTSVNTQKVKEKKTYDPYYVKISKKLLKSFKIKYLKLNETDIGIFNFLLLHQSGFNNSNHLRWSLIHRIFDFSNTQSIENNYNGGLMEGNIYNSKKHEKFIL